MLSIRLRPLDVENVHATPASWIALALSWLGAIAGDAIAGLTLQRMVLASTLVFTILNCILQVRKILNLSRNKKDWDAVTDKGGL